MDAQDSSTAEAQQPVVLEAGGLPQPLDWRVVFGNDRPVEIEIGFGKGGFLVQVSQKFPERNFLGLETAAKMVEYAAGRLRKRGIRNVRLLRADAHYFLERFVRDGSVAGFHIYFPDPWPKQRHRKRRLLTPEFCRAVQRVLLPGGRICFATDFQEYFGQVRELFSSFPAFQALDPGDWVTRRPQEAITNYEIKYRREGRPIYYALYERVEAG